MKKIITYSAYIQLEGIFALMTSYANKIEELIAVAGEILGDGTDFDDYDAAYPLADNMYQNADSVRPFLKRAGIEIKGD